MNKDLKQEKPKEEIKSDNRYNRKLLNQAYKKAKKAREVEKKNKRKKKFLRIFIYTLIPIVLISIVLSIFFLLPKNIDFIEAVEKDSSKTFYEWGSEGVNHSQSLDISVINLSATSSIVFNPKNGAILFERNSTEKRSIASLTKIVSAIIILENYDLNESIEVSVENIPQDLDWTLGLVNGDKMMVEDLLKSMLISSYNDSGYILANAYPDGGYAGFVSAMNRKAKALQMNNSHFSNPSGLDDEGNYSTAMDLALLLSSATNYSKILEITALSKDTIKWNSKEGLVSKEILTTNQLYGINSYVRGLKTGVTDLAGECFVGYFVYPNSEELITVVLQSKDRFKDTTLLEKYSRQLLK